MECYIASERGERIDPINFVTLAAAATINNFGTFVIELAADTPRHLLKVDRIIEVERTPEGGTKSVLLAGFIRKWRFYDVDGEEHIKVWCFTPEYLLDGRIIPYAAGSAYTTKTDYADDMLKEIVKQNLGASATDSARDLSALGLSVQGDQSDAPQVTKSFAYRKVLNTLQDICKLSAEAGTLLYFAIVPYLATPLTIGFRFETYINQPGVDHGSTSQNPVTFSPQHKNLINGYVEHDHADEVTAVYAGGQGEEASREVVEVEDTTRQKSSVWNRREAFADARNESTTAGVTAKGNEALRAGRPVLGIGGTLIDTSSFAFGQHWRLGDRVVVEYGGVISDAIVDSIQIDFSGEDDGEEIRGGFTVL